MLPDLPVVAVDLSAVLIKADRIHENLEALLTGYDFPDPALALIHGCYTDLALIRAELRVLAAVGAR